ncbi:hypothetical protein TTHT_1765 [Thermotomaculum hydrothermale]|uniref:Uncharacterized protein n=1 Tax=Thermotomaculum hydrothermale TaxID=981385 RepID=A0A7R6PNB6_9BACT|nr:hypothetical protein [Thermotomaculum hydrothermale]BBB33232.1 hypothetical protein TTHT_1765 [Thermotomaculum hydrothermale]
MNKLWLTILLLICILNQSFTYKNKKIEISPITKTKGYYAGVINLYIKGGFYPLETLFCCKNSYPLFDGSNPFIFSYSYGNSSVEKALENGKDYLYYVVVKGELTYGNKHRMVFGNIKIEKVIYSRKVTEDFLDCILNKEFPDEKINYYRKHPLKVLDICPMKNPNKIKYSNLNELKILKYKGTIERFENKDKKLLENKVYCGILDNKHSTFSPIDRLLSKSFNTKCIKHLNKCGFKDSWQSMKHNEIHYLLDDSHKRFFFAIAKMDFIPYESEDYGIIDIKKIYYLTPISLETMKKLLKLKLPESKINFLLKNPEQLVRFIEKIGEKNKLK